MKRNYCKGIRTCRESNDVHLVYIEKSDNFKICT